MSKVTQGIQTLPANFSTANAISAQVALIVNGSYGASLTRDFLLKTYRLMISLGDMDADDVIICGLARGDMTIAQIKAALETKLPDPEDFDLQAAYSERNGIFWQSLRIIDSSVRYVNDEISIGGKNGIPLEAGHGCSFFLYNPDGANSATLDINGLYALVGVFMEGSN